MKKRTPQAKKDFVWEDSAAQGEEVLWCDAEYVARIKAVNGVVMLTQWLSRPCFNVLFNPRYDRKKTKAAIEAIITGAPDAQD